MDIKEVEKEYCSRCPSYKYGCGFITRELQDKCSQLSDYTDGYERGYEQAKKDMELCWEDIPEIFRISEELKTSWWFRDNEQTKLIGTQAFWEEVLKRFKDYKERKENGE